MEAGPVVMEMDQISYRVMFWVLFFLVCVALIADLEGAFGTFRHAIAVIVPMLIIGALAVAGIGYCALAYVFYMDGRREKRMSKAELEREYLRRVAGVDRRPL
jgi:hypothetical protein